MPGFPMIVRQRMRPLSLCVSEHFGNLDNSGSQVKLVLSIHANSRVRPHLAGKKHPNRGATSSLRARKQRNLRPYRRNPLPEPASMTNL